MYQKCWLGAKGYVIMFVVALLILKLSYNLGVQINNAEFSSLSRRVGDFYDAAMNYKTKVNDSHDDVMNYKTKVDDCYDDVMNYKIKEFNETIRKNDNTDFNYTAWKSIQEKRKSIYKKERQL